jgi:hypothetical protein
MGTRACTVACTVACVAAAAPDLRTLAGWLAGRFDIADDGESERARGSNTSADREGRESSGRRQGTHTLACNHTCAITSPHTHTRMHTLACERTI